MKDWLLAFALTQLIEAPLYTLALRRRGGRSWAAAMGIAFGASALTHPFVWFAFPAAIDPLVLRIAVSEVFALVVETLWLAAFRLPRPWAWALAVNGASFGVGVLLSLLTGWP